MSGEIKMFLLHHLLSLTLIHERKSWANRKFQKKVSHSAPIPESLSDRISLLQPGLLALPFGPSVFLLSTPPITTLATPLTCLERCELQPPAHLHHCILGHSFDVCMERTAGGAGAERNVKVLKSDHQYVDTELDRLGHQRFSCCDKESRKYWTTSSYLHLKRS